MDNTAAIQRERATIEGYLCRLHEQTRKAEAERDRLLLQLTDSAGAHDARPVAVR